jgi:hypothetical protein
VVEERQLLVAIFIAPIAFLAAGAWYQWNTGSRSQVDPKPFIIGNLPWTAANVATLASMLYLARKG